MKVIKKIFFIIIILLVIFLIFLGVFAFKMKTSVYLALEAKDNLEQGINNFSQKDYISAKEKISQAREDLSKAELEIKTVKASFFAYPFNRFGELEQLEELIGVADSLAFNFYKAADLSYNINSSLSQGLDNNQTAVLELIKFTPELKGLKANLSLVIFKLNNISLSGWLYPANNYFITFKNSLLDSWQSLETTFPLLELAPYVLGYPSESNFLLVFQNSHELRPSGGFIGSYAILKANLAKLELIESGDSYHLDMPVKDSLVNTPPAPLSKYLKVDKWFFRDANWSPSWKYSAINILNTYDKISKAWPEDRESLYQGEFSGVIALTPELVADVLKITGPIEIMGEVFTSDNFHTQLQYAVEVSYKDKDISSWDRKDIIGELIKELELRISNFSANEYLKLFFTLDTNLNEKNILFYFKNDYAQSIVENLNWAGEVKQSQSDYLMIVDANLAALKTDAVISRQAKYFLNESNGDQYEAKLQLSYSNKAKKADWRTSRYQSYTRIYLPPEAYDVKASGFSSELDISEDKLLNKLVVGAYLLVNLDQKEIVEVSYKLPKSAIIENNLYKLLWQKQAGTNWQIELAIDLDNNLDVKEIKPKLMSQTILSTNNFYWDLLLDSDKVFEIKF